MLAANISLWDPACDCGYTEINHTHTNHQKQQHYNHINNINNIATRIKNKTLDSNNIHARSHGCYLEVYMTPVVAVRHSQHDAVLVFGDKVLIDRHSDSSTTSIT